MLLTVIITATITIIASLVVIFVLFNKFKDEKEIKEYYQNLKNKALNENLELKEEAGVLNKLVQDKEAYILEKEDQIRLLKKEIANLKRKNTNLEKKVNISVIKPVEKEQAEVIVEKAKTKLENKKRKKKGE